MTSAKPAKELSPPEMIAAIIFTVIFVGIFFLLLRGCESLLEATEPLSEDERKEQEEELEEFRKNKFQYEKDQETYDALKELEWTLDYYNN